MRVCVFSSRPVYVAVCSTYVRTSMHLQYIHMYVHLRAYVQYIRTHVRTATHQVYSVLEVR